MQLAPDWWIYYMAFSLFLTCVAIIREMSAEMRRDIFDKFGVSDD